MRVIKACLEGNLVPLGKGILSDELHNLVEVLLLLQDLTNLRSNGSHSDAPTTSMQDDARSISGHGRANAHPSTDGDEVRVEVLVKLGQMLLVL